MKRLLPRLLPFFLLAVSLCASVGQAEDKAAPVKRAKKRIVIAAPAPAAAVNDPMVLQWQNQFRPALLSELNFIRQICDLKPEQRPPIRAAGEKSLREAAVKFARFQQGVRVVNGVQQSQPTPQPIIRDGLATALKTLMSPDQFARYEQESKARAQQRKRAAILSVTARLDGALSLSSDQRQKIVDTLSDKWQDDWEQWLMVNRYGEQYFPQIPDDVLVPLLDSAQRPVWRGLSKIGAGHYGSPFAQPPDDVAWWGGEAPNAVGPPEAVDRAGAVEVRRTVGGAILDALSDLFGIK
jgi:hypothetical protein